MNQQRTTLIESLPGRVYVDAGVYAAEQREIFARSWQCVGHVGKLREPGDFFVCEVADESLVVMRDAATGLNAFYNVCAHRAARVLDGEGCRTRFACPYHAWSYNTRGELVAAPNARNVAGFDVANYRLRPVRLAEIDGLVFVNLDDDAADLETLAPELFADLRRYAPDLPALHFVHRTEAMLDCNWKIAIENYAECYHCELLHKSLTNGVLDMKSYHIEVFAQSQRHRSRARADTARLYEYGDADETEFVAWWMWPGFSFQSYPGGRMHVWRWTPLSVDRTHLTVDWYFPSTELADWERQLIDSHAATTFVEDQAVMALAQQGLGSRGYVAGPLMVDRDESQYSEHAVVAIQQLWRDEMGERFDA